jgi:hypothetical protein
MDLVPLDCLHDVIEKLVPASHFETSLSHAFLFESRGSSSMDQVRSWNIVNIAVSGYDRLLERQCLYSDNSQHQANPIGFSRHGQKHTHTHSLGGCTCTWTEHPARFFDWKYVAPWVAGQIIALQGQEYSGVRLQESNPETIFSALALTGLCLGSR